MTLQLHGIVRATHETSYRLVVRADLAVVVTEFDRALTEADALPHMEMLCSLVASGPVVPLVFGTVADDEDTVRTGLLPPIADTVRAQLDRLTDVVECHMYLRFAEHAWLTADTVFEPVMALARESVPLPDREDRGKRRAFLVARDRVAAARAAATRFAGDEVAVDFVGPLPAFSFLTSAVASRWGW